jgi:uncharacterized repeat protein (TIGR03803 family)
MKSLDSVCHVLGGFAAAAMLAGCGGSQPPIGAPGAMSQSSTNAPAHAIAYRIEPANSYRVLHRFNDLGLGTHHRAYNGANPYGDLIDVNGTLYGTTEFGGGGFCVEGGCGTVYSISTAGAHTVLSRFADGAGGGANPIAGLIVLNGTLYGTTFDSGTGSGGTGGSVYSVTTTGTVKALHTFAGGSDGANPWAGLVAVKGLLYGTTTAGGGNTSECAFLYGCGTVYSISTSGTYAMLYSFSFEGGAVPWAGLINVNGTLYGSTEYGGDRSCSEYGCGVVFSITARGKERVLHSFTGGSDGGYPYAGLINVKGLLYGTTIGGGTYGKGTVYSITTIGTEKVLYSLAGGSDGARPYAGLIDVKGTLYGTTTEGGGAGCGGNGCGTIYSISTAGTEAVLHSFGGSPDGASPYAGLIDVNGTLYGTTAGGGGPRCGTSGCGTVFTLKL